METTSRDVGGFAEMASRGIGGLVELVWLGSGNWVRAKEPSVLQVTSSIYSYDI